MMRYNIVQINLNHCWGAQDLLQQYMKEKEVDIAIVSETIHIPDRNWVGNGNRSSDALGNKNQSKDKGKF